MLFGATDTPAAKAALSADGVRASFEEIIAAVRAAMASGALPEDRLNAAVTAVLHARGAALC